MGLALVAAAPAAAQPSRVDLQTFHAAATSGGLVNLEGTAIGPTLWPRVGVQLSYQRDPLVDQPGDSEQIAVVSNRLHAEAVFGMGLFDRVEIGLAAPFILYQAGQDAADAPASGGSGDMRLLSKLRIVGHDVGFSLAVLGVLRAPSGADKVMGGSGWGGEGLCLAAYGWEGLSLHAAAGYRGQGVRELGSVVVDDQILLGAGARYRLGSFALLGELTAATAADAPFGSAERSPALGTVGVSYTFGAVSVTVAGGAGVYPGHGTPVAHATLGVTFSPSAADYDSDGIPDNRDACMALPEDRDGFRDEDGCPDRDNDEDGLLDADDRCPDRAAIYGTGPHRDGCPGWKS